MESRFWLKRKGKICWTRPQQVRWTEGQQVRRQMAYRRQGQGRSRTPASVHSPRPEPALIPTTREDVDHLNKAEAMDVAYYYDLKFDPIWTTQKLQDSIKSQLFPQQDRRARYSLSEMNRRMTKAIDFRMTAGQDAPSFATKVAMRQTVYIAYMKELARPIGSATTEAWLVKAAFLDCPAYLLPEWFFRVGGEYTKGVVKTKQEMESAPHNEESEARTSLPFRKKPTRKVLRISPKWLPKKPKTKLMKAAPKMHAKRQLPEDGKGGAAAKKTPAPWRQTRISSGATGSGSVPPWRK